MSYSRRSRYSPSPSPYRHYRRSVTRSLSRSRSPSWDRDSSDAENPGNNLYVTGLSPRITKRELEKHFSSEGMVVDVHLVVDPWTRHSRGFGFVTMSNVDEANCCIKYLDGSALEGRVITVEKARRRRGRTPTPGKYLGLRTARGRRRSPTYSPYARSRSGSYSSERGRSRSFSPHYSRHRSRNGSYSLYYSRRRTPSRSRSPYCSPVRRRERSSYSPYDSPDDRCYRGRRYSPDDRRYRGRRYSPDDRRYGGRYYSPDDRRYRYGGRYHSPDGYRGRCYRSLSRSISPSVRRNSRRSYSRSITPSVSPPRPRRRGDSPSVSPKKTSPRSGSYKRKHSREDYSYRSPSRSGSISASSRSFSRSVTPRSSSH